MTSKDLQSFGSFRIWKRVWPAAWRLGVVDDFTIYNKWGCILTSGKKSFWGFYDGCQSPHVFGSSNHMASCKKQWPLKYMALSSGCRFSISGFISNILSLFHPTFAWFFLWDMGWILSKWSAFLATPPFCQTFLQLLHFLNDISRGGQTPDVAHAYPHPLPGDRAGPEVLSKDGDDMVT